MRFAPFAFLLLVPTLMCGHAGAADTLARVKETHELRMGYFEASAPFSFTGPDKSAQGCIVWACRRRLSASI